MLGTLTYFLRVKHGSMCVHLTEYTENGTKTCLHGIKRMAIILESYLLLCMSLNFSVKISEMAQSKNRIPMLLQILSTDTTHVNG